MPDSYSLVPQERNDRRPVAPTACGPHTDPEEVGVVFRHSGWQPARSRIRAAIARSQPAETRLDAWDGCGRNAVVLSDPETPGAYRIACTTCKDRFCVPCANSRSQQIGRRLRNRVEPGTISFMTLTLRDNNISLQDLLNKLIQSFRKLRTSPIWRREVVGGVAFLELKYNLKNGRWHPHLHAIMEAGYIPQTWLSNRWCDITHGSFKVDIRRAKNHEHAISYVTRYGSKALNQSFVHHDDRLQEAIQALHGRHLSVVFGDWRGWCLHDDDEHEKWPVVASLSALVARARRGDTEAIRIMEYLKCTTLIAITSETKSRAPPNETTNESPRSSKDLYGVCDVVTNLISTLGQL